MGKRSECVRHRLRVVLCRFIFPDIGEHSFLHESLHDLCRIIIGKLHAAILLPADFQREHHPTGRLPTERLHRRTAPHRLRRADLHKHIRPLSHGLQFILDPHDMKAVTVHRTALQAPVLVSIKKFFLNQMVQAHAAKSSLLFAILPPYDISQCGSRRHTDAVPIFLISRTIIIDFVSHLRYNKNSIQRGSSPLMFSYNRRYVQ